MNTHYKILKNLNIVLFNEKEVIKYRKLQNEKYPPVIILKGNTISQQSLHFLYL